MRLVVNYLDTLIDFDNDKVWSLEIENKSYFWRIVSNLISLQNGDIVDDIMSFKDDKEIDLSGKISVILDYFNLNDVFRKYHTLLFKYIVNSLDDSVREELVSSYMELNQKVIENINNLEVSCVTTFDVNMESIIKMLKLSINLKDKLLDNLLLIIDLERELRVNRLLVFVNLKGYLKKDEIGELYKYALYNEVEIMLIDSNSYGGTLNNEKKLIIDGNFEEIVIK